MTSGRCIDCIDFSARLLRRIRPERFANFAQRLCRMFTHTLLIWQAAHYYACAGLVICFSAIPAREAAGTGPFLSVTSGSLRRF